ncbi:hypothetical protein GCM10009430_09730 [Aquimarina litoralis]|uniref:Uncharacterized protein n=1 Tax=Aquimarina litoralis TaxID=584605 RepID=A0ABN1IJF0_9FLAO
MKYNEELQVVLKSMFIAERKYFEATQKVQVLDFLRFLNHQNIIRNSYINRLVEVFERKNIGLNIFEIEKRKYALDSNDRNVGWDIEKYDQKGSVKECLEQDQELIKQCTNCINNIDISLEILEILTEMCTALIFYNIDGQNLIKEHTKKYYDQQSLVKRAKSMV